MTAGTVVLLIIAAGIALAAFVPGHWAGRRSRRFDYPDGWDAGKAAERAWWEKATGTLRETWETRRDTSPGGAWPYGFSCDPAIPSAELLLAPDAAERLAGADAARVPPVAEADELAARYHAAQRAPVVASVTDAARWRPRVHDGPHYPGCDAPTMEGVIVTARPRRAPQAVPEDDWDLLAGRALPDYAAEALGGHRTVDELVDSMVRRARPS